jgi:asparagine synthase (glutamine-hydrolysing)
VGSLQEASVLLRKTTQLSISSQAALHKKVYVSLSGGLDSSIVLGCLAKMQDRPEIIGINFFCRGNGDERRYARSMAQKAEISLVEKEHNPTVDLKIFLNCARTANPTLNFSACDVQPTMVQLAVESGATAVYNGELGDDLFGHAFGPDALADCITRYGVGARYFRAAYDYARLRRVSVWSAVKQGARCWKDLRSTPFWNMYRYAQAQGISREAKLATDETLEFYERELSRFVHPWLVDVEGLPAGRFQMTVSLITATSTWSHAPFAGESDSLFVMPLATQPLAEAYPRIPARLHILGGQNGAVLRLAFGDMLSDLVLRRGTGKGTPDLWLKDALERNRPFMRDFMLDGLLVKERIVDRRKLDTVLSGSLNKARVPTSEIIIQLFIEAWLRRWCETSKRAAA